MILSFVNLAMAKVSQILVLILIPVFLSSTGLLNCLENFSIPFHIIEVTLNECTLDGENNEQNEEQLESENDICAYALINYKYYFKKDICFSNTSFLFIPNIIDRYSPPPEIII